MRCLGLYCFLEGIPTSHASHVMVLRGVLLTQGEAPAVKAVAAQVGAAGGGRGGQQGGVGSHTRSLLRGDGCAMEYDAWRRC